MHAVVVAESCLLSPDKKKWNTAWRWRDGVVEFRFVCGTTLKYSNAITSIYTDIEGVALETFNALSKTVINSTTLSCQRHVVFHYFLSDDSKQDSATTTAHIKLLI